LIDPALGAEICGDVFDPWQVLFRAGQDLRLGSLGLEFSNFTVAISLSCIKVDSVVVDILVDDS